MSKFTEYVHLHKITGGPDYLSTCRGPRTTPLHQYLVPSGNICPSTGHHEHAGRCAWCSSSRLKEKCRGNAPMQQRWFLGTVSDHNPPALNQSLHENSIYSATVSKNEMVFTLQISNQLVGWNAHSLSWRENNRDAHGFDNKHCTPCQKSHFALFCRFVGVLGLFKDGNLVVEHDDGYHCNLFDLREPTSAAPGQHYPSISERLTCDQCILLLQRRKV